MLANDDSVNNNGDIEDVDNEDDVDIPPLVVQYSIDEPRIDRPASTISPLRLQGGNCVPQVETVTEDNPANIPTNKNSNNNNVPTETTTTKSSSLEAKDDPMVDEPDPVIIPPLLTTSKNKYWGDLCKPGVYVRDRNLIVSMAKMSTISLIARA